jgi:hypothetical protein
MASALALLMPSFAPLPQELVLHLLANRRRDTILKKSRKALKTITIQPTTPLEEESNYTMEEWESLLQEIKPIRQVVFEEMDAAIRDEKLTIAWISQRLLEATPRRETPPRLPKVQEDKEPTRHPRQHTGIPRTTLDTWEQRGLAQFSGRNSPDPDVFAALWIARLADRHRLRDWLPQKIDRVVDRPLDTQPAPDAGMALDSLATKTWLTCYRWDPPPVPGDAAPDPQPCPIPLPGGLSSETILASPWQGFLWRPFWRRRINSLGVARWYGADERSWTVSLDGLSRWFPGINELTVPHMEQSAPDVFQELANICLNRLAYTLLSGKG